jgi:hypothetical protein
MPIRIYMQPHFFKLNAESQVLTDIDTPLSILQQVAVVGLVFEQPRKTFSHFG